MGNTELPFFSRYPIQEKRKQILFIHLYVNLQLQKVNQLNGTKKTRG